jgi:dihydroorotate dehydrogenase (NAD+) catalytic subunit
MSNRPVKIGNLKLKNPIILASGTFDRGIADKIDLNKLGGIVTKTITLKPRKGNPLPHIFKTKYGWLNSVGWKNLGLKKYLAEELPFWQNFKTEIITSIGGFSFEEYIKITKILEQKKIKIIEIDVSCMNIDKSDTTSDKKIISNIRKLFSGTIIVKLAPDIIDVCDNAKSAITAGAEALTIANTYPGLELVNGKPIFSRKIAGYSGGAIKPLTMAMVWKVSQKFRCPIIASGGAENTQDVLDYLTVGAKAVQIGSANFLNPKISAKIVDELKRR